MLIKEDELTPIAFSWMSYSPKLDDLSIFSRSRTTGQTVRFMTFLSRKPFSIRYSKVEFALLRTYRGNRKVRVVRKFVVQKVNKKVLKILWIRRAKILKSLSSQIWCWNSLKDVKKNFVYKITVDSSDKYFSTISKIWSKRNTPKDWTKFWSSCVRHVHKEIMLPLPTRAALTSTSVTNKKKIH